MANMTTKASMSLPGLQGDASKTLSDYLTKDDGLGTERLRQVAEDFIAAREHFYTQEGEPDWLGRTYAYRVWVRETMSLANVPPGQLSTVQAAIRYHAGNILRDRLSVDTLESLGLRAAGPRERSIEKRGKAAETLSLFGSGGQEITSREDALQVSRVIAATLRRLAPEVVSNPEVRAALTAALAPICVEIHPEPLTKTKRRVTK